MNTISNNTSGNSGNDEGGADELTTADINAEAERLQAMNADIEKQLGKYLKPDYVPEGAPSSELKEKVIEAGDKKEQDEMAAELDGALVDIFAHIADIKQE